MAAQPPLPFDPVADVARREKLATEIVAEGLLTLLIRERLRQLDAADAHRAVDEEEAARAPIAGAPFGRAGAVR